MYRFRSSNNSVLPGISSQAECQLSESRQPHLVLTHFTKTTQAIDGTNNNILMSLYLLLVEYKHMIGGSFDFKAEHKLSKFQALSAFKETETDGIKASARVSLICGTGKLVVGRMEHFQIRQCCQLCFNTHLCS